MTNKGFTLIETLFSLALTVFLIAGAAELMTRAAHLKKKSDSLTATSGLAASRIEALRALPFDSAALAEGSYEELVRDRATGRPFQVKWTIDRVDDLSKLITVLVRPAQTSDRGTELKMTLSRSLGF